MHVLHIELPGIPGGALYHYQNDTLLIQIPGREDQFLTGNHARVTFTRVQDITPSDVIDEAFKLARDITGASDLGQRHKGTRVLWARYIFAAFLVEQKGFSQTRVGHLIDRDASTVLSGLKKFSVESKFLPPLEKEFKIKYENYCQSKK